MSEHPQRGPHRPSTKRRAFGAAVGLALLAGSLAACSSTGGKPSASGGGLSAGAANTPRITLAMVTHGAPGDTYWDLVRKGAEAAAAKDNVELKYSSDPQAPNQANLVQSAVDSKVAGIAVTLAKPDAMAPAVKAAQTASIPVVALNAGIADYKGMGIQEYFGQDENLAGQAAGKRLNDEGAKHVVCVIHEQGNVSLESRCAGVKQTFKGTLENLNVNGTDMPSVAATIGAKLQQDSSIDTLLTLGAPFALTAVQAVQNANSKAKVVTFDTNAALVGAIKSGDVQWAVDQQPYLQGYAAIDALWLYLNNGSLIGGGGPVLTGPAFIDKSNIAAIAKYVTNGTR